MFWSNYSVAIVTVKVLNSSFWNMVSPKLNTSKPPIGLTTEIWK